VYPILEKDDLARPAGQIARFVIEAPFIAKRAKVGQFVIVRVHNEGERIPLTLVDWDAARGTVTLIVQAVGKTTHHMHRLKAGEAIADICGPLGLPVPIVPYGTVVCIGGGVGAAEILPIARAFKEAGNHVIGIIGARTRDLVILEDEMRVASHELYVTTDDGTYARKGLVTDVLADLHRQGTPIDAVISVGPLPMMRAVANLTRQASLKSFASLNPIMMDGTGMCGACRVRVGGEVKFTCIDGPMFDANQVDFEMLAMRNRAYVKKEKESLELFLKTYGQELELVGKDCARTGETSAQPKT
jgi:ferredoxin--NADP+ reductase